MINIGSGEEVSILKLAKLILKLAGHNAKINFLPNSPDGTPRKLLNSKKIRSLGWKPTIKLVDGLKKTYNLYEKKKNIRL